LTGQTKSYVFDFANTGRKITKAVMARALDHVFAKVLGVAGAVKIFGAKKW